MGALWSLVFRFKDSDYDDDRLGTSDMPQRKALCLPLSFLILSALASTVYARDFAMYVRGLAGTSNSLDTSFTDADCSSESPYAYFGCGPGENGKPLGAYGDFGETALLEAGLGGNGGGKLDHGSGGIGPLRAE